MFHKYAVAIIPVSVALLVITTYYGQLLGWAKILFDNLFLLFGVSTLIGCFSLMLGNGIIHNKPYLTKSVFFIYAFHVFPLPGIVSITVLCQKLTEKFVVESQVITYFIYLAVCPIAVLSACLAIYSLLYRYTPKLLSILTGQR